MEEYKTKNTDIVLVNYHNTDDTIQCLNSLKKVHRYLNRIILVDNSVKSDPLLTEFISHYPEVSYLVSSNNLGFSGGNNLGIRESLKDERVKYILLLNNDTLVDEEFLIPLVEKCEKEKADIATGKIYLKGLEKVLNAAGGTMDWKKGMGMLRGLNQQDNGQFDYLRNTDFISGCMMLINRKVFEKIGFLDEKYFMYCEDVDFCLHARRENFKMIFVPDSKIWHKVGAKSLTDSGFYFYYFFRNSIYIVKKYANNFQKLLYFIYAPLYFFVKMLRVVKQKPAIFLAFVSAIWDGLLNRSGKKSYKFLEG